MGDNQLPDWVEQVTDFRVLESGSVIAVFENDIRELSDDEAEALGKYIYDGRYK